MSEQNVAKTSTTGWHSISPGMQIFSQELFPAYPNLQIQKKERRPGVDTPALEDWMHNIIMIITLTHNACVTTIIPASSQHINSCLWEPVIITAPLLVEHSGIAIILLKFELVRFSGDHEVLGYRASSTIWYQTP